jgi:hypothetical protein
VDMTTDDLLVGDLRPQAGIDVLVAVRLVQLVAYSTDAASTPVTRRAEKTRLLGELVTATCALPDEVELPSGLEGIAALANDETLPSACRDLLAVLQPRLADGDVRFVLLEVSTSTDWPRGLSWVEERDVLVAGAAAILDPAINEIEIAWVNKSYRSAAKRLHADATSPGAQAVQVTVHGAVAALSGGAANGLGAFIGSHFMGLSGAAATSAGLAFLGGGSLASGGLGMAGGAWVVHLGLGATKAGGQRVLSHLVSVSSDALIEALARLDVLVGMEPERVPGTIAALEGIIVDLRSELKEVRPDDLGARRSRIAKALLDGVVQPTRLRRAARVAAEEFPVEERRLARALRAVDHELRHLQSTTWKRRAARVPRVLGVPSASRLLDRL